jgi:hypothetical protein
MTRRRRRPQPRRPDERPREPQCVATERMASIASSAACAIALLEVEALAAIHTFSGRSPLGLVGRRQRCMQCHSVAERELLGEGARVPLRVLEVRVGKG